MTVIRVLFLILSSCILLLAASDLVAQQKDELELRTIKTEKIRVLSGIAFRPDGKIIASNNSMGTINFWNAQTGKKVAQFKIPNKSEQFSNLTFSPNGKVLASTVNFPKPIVYLWNVSTGKVVKTLDRGEKGGIYSVQFSPDGKKLATGSADKTIRIWDLKTGKTIHVLTGHTKTVGALDFGPEGKTLVSGSQDEMVKLWDVNSGKEIASLSRGHILGIFGVAYSPDGKLIVSAGHNNILNFWDVKTHKRIIRLRGHKGFTVYCVAFSPDGKILASGGSDKAIILWNVAEKKKIVTLEGHTGSVRDIAFSPDGKTLVSREENGTIKVWKVPVLE